MLLRLHIVRYNYPRGSRPGFPFIRITRYITHTTNIRNRYTSPALARRLLCRDLRHQSSSQRLASYESQLEELEIVVTKPLLSVMLECSCLSRGSIRTIDWSFCGLDIKPAAVSRVSSLLYSVYITSHQHRLRVFISVIRFVNMNLNSLKSTRSLQVWVK